MIIVKFSSYAVLKTNVYALALFSPKQQKCFHDVDSTHISTVSLSEFVLFAITKNSTTNDDDFLNKWKEVEWTNFYCIQATWSSPTQSMALSAIIKMSHCVYGQIRFLPISGWFEKAAYDLCASIASYQFFCIFILKCIHSVIKIIRYRYAVT